LTSRSDKSVHAGVELRQRVRATVERKKTTTDDYSLAFVFCDTRFSLLLSLEFSLPGFFSLLLLLSLFFYFFFLIIIIIIIIIITPSSSAFSLFAFVSHWNNNTSNHEGNTLNSCDEKWVTQ
jgi:hypothetical protein